MPSSILEPLLAQRTRQTSQHCCCKVPLRFASFLEGIGMHRLAGSCMYLAVEAFAWCVCMGVGRSILVGPMRHRLHILVSRADRCGKIMDGTMGIAVGATMTDHKLWLGSAGIPHPAPIGDMATPEPASHSGCSGHIRRAHSAGTRKHFDNFPSRSHANQRIFCRGRDQS